MCYKPEISPLFTFQRKHLCQIFYTFFSRSKLLSACKKTPTSKTTLKYRERRPDRISHASPHVAWYSRYTYAPANWHHWLFFYSTLKSEISWMFNLFILIVGWICMPKHFFDYLDYSQNNHAWSQKNNTWSRRIHRHQNAYKYFKLLLL